MPSEIKRVYALMNQKRQFDYLIIPAKSFVKNVSVSNEAALKYYQTHADEFKVPEQVSLSYLQLSLKDIAKTIKPAQSELINFYQNNLGTFTTPRQVKIKQLLIAVAPNASSDDWNKALDKMNALAAQLKKGADFDALVKTNSQSPQKEAFWISTARLSPAVNQNLKLMKSSGDISMPVKTQLGYVIIKLLDSKPQKVSAFKEVEAKVSKNYQDQAAQKRFSTLSDQLANETFENPTSLDKAAKNLNLSIKTTDFFSQQGTKDGLASHDNVVHAAFSEDVLQGNNSDLINLDDNDVIVVRLKTHKPASEKPFDQVKDDIINKLKVQEAANNAQTFGQALLTSLQKGESINSQLTSQGLSFKTTDFVARHETKKIDSVVVNMAFDIPRSSLQKPDQSIAGQALSSGDYAIVKLKAVQDGQLDKPSVLDQFGAGYTAALGAQAYNFYVDSLLKRAKISYLNNQ